MEISQSINTFGWPSQMNKIQCLDQRPWQYSMLDSLTSEVIWTNSLNNKVGAE